MESEILIARICDTQQLADKTNRPKFLGFLSCEEAALAQKALEKCNAEFMLWGGYPSAQRVMLCCMPDWCTEVDFPISAISFSFRTADTLRHRDFLGALMSLGITRESVGDILVESGRAVVFLKSEILPFVMLNVRKIGRVGVVASKGFSEPLPEIDRLISSSVTVSSPRLDCVVSALAGVSRSRADEFINLGFVSVNSVVCEKSTKQITAGDVITVRTRGKFIIDSTSGKTKKDRIILEFKKYF